MPIQPGVWYSGPLSPQQLNQDLYSWNGTGYGSNGILFFSHRVILHESLSSSHLMTVTTSGTWNTIPGTANSGTSTGFSIVDTGALFGQGGDNPGGYALYQFTPNALGTSGISYQPGNVSPVAAPGKGNAGPAFPAGAGGNYLAFHTVTAQTASTGPAAVGAGLVQTPGFGEVFVWQGGMQPHTAGTQGAAYFLDLINAGGGAYGTITSPVADEQLCQMLIPYGNGPGGSWVADWAVEILSTASTNDVNNFSLVLGGHTVATSSNPGTVGIYSQTPYTFATTVTTGEYLAITAGAATPTTQTTYGGVIYGDGVPTVGNGYTWLPSVFLADGSAVSEQLPAQANDTAGFTPRHSWVWASVSQQGQLNPLNANAYTPDGNLAGWTASTLSTITSVVPPGTPPPSAYAVQLNGTGSGTVARAYTPAIAATPGSVYQVYTNTLVNAAANTYSVLTGVDWYNASGVFISRTGLGGPIPQNSWTPVSSWNTAPSNAATGLPFGEIETYPSPGGTIPASVTTYLSGVVVVNPTAPSPQASWTGPLTSAALNGPGGPSQALTFLNNPPAMRVAEGLTTSIPNSAITPVTFPTNPWVAPGIDTYNAFLSLTGAYNVPVSGLYLAFACFPFTANTTGSRYAGFQVTSATTAATTTTQFAGPAYSAVTVSGAPTSACAMRVLDLQNTDSVTPLAYQNSGGSLALTDGAPGYASRFGMLYLSNLSSGGVSSLTPPQTSFHWYAGIPPSALAGYMNQHLGNDLAFLIGRPYFTGYQGTAQTGLANGSWNAVTIDTPGGLVHGSAGDNFGGWNASGNYYAAQVPGWYLVMCEVYASLPSAATGFIYAGINCPTSGGISPTASPDQYQTMFAPATTGPHPGAAAIGVYYLAKGEYVQPMIKCANWGGNYSTAVGTNPTVASQFSVLWICE